MSPDKGTRKVYTVETDSKGGWRGKAKGSTRAVAKGDNKAEVVKRTIEVAKKQPKARVRIKGRTAESRTSAPTLGAATPRELRADRARKRAVAGTGSCQWPQPMLHT
jgi:hypothetical protein